MNNEDEMPTLWQYCWLIIVVSFLILALHKCGENNEASERARAIGTEVEQ